jgi:hypothetical protein
VADILHNQTRGDEGGDPNDLTSSKITEENNESNSEFLYHD